MDSWFEAGAAERPSGQQIRFFAQAADTSKRILNTRHNAPSLLNDIWASKLALYIQAIVMPLAFWFKPVCVCLALFWLSYRAYRVLYKPLDELAALLGFDIPLIPSIDLAGIKADGAIIHWTLPEKQKYKSSYKYEIHLNGTVVETLPLQESAVTVSGLRPGSFYVVRIALVTNLEFSSKSAPIRFRTKPASSGDFFHAISDNHEADHEMVQEPLLRVKPYRGLKDIAPATADTIVPLLHREPISNLSRRRSNTGRRASPASAMIDSTIDKESDELASERQTIQQLTERLDTLRKENEEADRLAKEEEDEEVKLKDDLIKERDELRAEVAEKEKASRNLKREVLTMVQQNTTAQGERSKLEKLLQSKLQEREKLKEDVAKWTADTVQMSKDAEQIRNDKSSHLTQFEHDKTSLQRRLTDEAAAVKALEDDIKETTAEIKKVERSAKNSSPSGADAHFSLVEQLQHDAEEDRQWNMQLYEMQQKYTATVQRLEQSKRMYTNNMQYLEGVRERRRIEEAAAAAVAAAAASSSRDLVSPPSTQERLPSRRDSQRSRRENSGGLTDSPRATTFGPQPAFGGSLNTTGFPNAPLFASTNGLNAAMDSDGLSDEDREKLTGGVLMSPGAGEGLLPADLFTSDERATENVLPLPGLGSLPGIHRPLPGLGQQTVQQDYPGPASPASVSSRAASTFASPQASQANLHSISSPEGVIDSDGRSIRSNRSGRAASGITAGSRFSAMFGIRPRAKNSALENSLGLPLGKTHSHSMPRQDHGISGLDSVTRKRNSSLSGDVFADAEAAVNSESAESPAQPKKRPFNLNPFSKDKAADGWPSSFSGFGRRPASPRPESTHSGELPRPSFDSSRWGVDAWQPGEAGAGARASPMSYGGWATPMGGRSFASRHQSRRTSFQHGVSNPPDDIIEDEDSDILDPDLEPHLAPIGTMPSASTRAERQVDTKLNPNAKDFKSFISSMRSRDKGKGKAVADAGSKTSTPGASNTPVIGKDSVEDESPPQSRKSRDARSTTTFESSVPESRRNSSELVLSPSYSNSEAAYSPQIGAGSSSLGKESFMQKITRKSSSSKFTLPTFKRDKGKAEGQSPALPPTEDEDDAMSASIGSLKEPRESSEKSRNNARSWSNVLKIGKKKGGDTPSISELSTASEKTGDDGLDET